MISVISSIYPTLCALPHFSTYRSESHQLHLAIGGFGCSPTARGQTIFCTNLYTGENAAFLRHEVLGVMDEANLPKWAKEKLAHMRDPNQRPSTLAQIEEGKKRQRETPCKPKTKHKGKDGSELE